MIAISFLGGANVSILTLHNVEGSAKHYGRKALKPQSKTHYQSHTSFFNPSLLCLLLSLLNMAIFVSLLHPTPSISNQN